MNHRAKPGEPLEQRQHRATTPSRRIKTLAVPEILDLINNPEEVEPIPLATYLGLHAKTSSLIDLLGESDDPFVRYTICWVFHLTKVRSAREPLLRALFDSDSNVRGAAADAYSAVGQTADGPIVMAAFRSERSKSIRCRLLHALGAIHYQSALPLIICSLKIPFFQREARWALTQLNGAEVRAALTAELEEETEPKWSEWLKACIKEFDATTSKLSH